MTASARLTCVCCDQSYDTGEVRYRCDCGGLLQVSLPDSAFQKTGPAQFDARLGDRKPVNRSGVWRFREALGGVPDSEIVTHQEGGTRLYTSRALSTYCGVEKLSCKHEGENPTGSFKDRGMTVAVSHARRLGVPRLACASTGNTSASLAAYGAQTGLQTLVLVPAGKVATGKLSQALGFGATCLAVRGDFDAAMKLVGELANRGEVYLVNSVNPFRLEGQKTIIWELLQDLEWTVPDWIAVPAGNLGNTSAFGKALTEAVAAGWIPKLPKLLAVQASGANPFASSFSRGFSSLEPVTAETVATAIRIGAPVNYDKAVRSIRATNGHVCQVSDEEILDAKRAVDGAGIGCEPASAAAVAGVRKMVAEGLVTPSERVACVLTGHMLKDPDATTNSCRGRIHEVDATAKALAPFL